MRTGLAMAMGTVLAGLVLSMIAKDLSMLFAGLAALGLVDRLRFWMMSDQSGRSSWTIRFKPDN